MMNLLPETLGELEARLGAWPHARSVIESLWGELTLPAACGGERTRESDIFWEQLHKIEPHWAEHVLLFVEQQQYDVASRTRARERYRAACNAMFSEDFRAGILRRLADVLDNQEFPLDTDPSFRNACLFRYHGGRDRHQSPKLLGAFGRAGEVAPRTRAA